MKNYKFFAFIFSLLLFAACEEVLDKTPADKYSDVSVWGDINLANRYLLNLYNAYKYDMRYRPTVNFTDDVHTTHGWFNNWFLGGTTADNISPLESSMVMFWDDNFYYIQQINYFLSKIDEVLDAYEEPEKSDIKTEVEKFKGEAYFLRAFCYHLLACNYGGVPIMKEPNELGEDFASVGRNTFEETINFIVEDCDKAFDLLGDDMEMGRATKGAALALKSRVLLFAASDLTADGTAENEYVGYANPDRKVLWTNAKNAAKEVMDLGLYELTDFGAPDRASVAENYFALFKSKDLSSKEIIWGKMFLPDAGVLNEVNKIHGPNSFGDYGCTAPSQNLVDFYQMEDGSDFFDHFGLDDEKYYRNISTKYINENIYYNRDPRFYGTILYDSAMFKPHLDALAETDPLGIYDRRTRITIQNGEEIYKRFGLDTKNGPIDAEDGTLTGYVIKKFQDDKLYTSNSKNENVWIEFRYAEVVMNYAEACLELGEESEAAEYINMIRNRAAMPDFSGDIWDALRYERRIEFALEARRWYDLRRWKMYEEALQENCKGVDIIEINNLDNNTITTTWQQVNVEDRGIFYDRMYWLPIEREEINKAPLLVNNPGYE